MKAPERHGFNWFFVTAGLLITSQPGLARGKEPAAPVMPQSATPASPPPAGPVLSLGDFMGQVQRQNGNFKSAQDSSAAAELKGKEAEIVLAPSLFGSTQYTDDKKPGTVYSYSENKTLQYQLGVSQTTAYGLSGRLYYNVVDEQFKDLSLGAASVSPHFVQASPVLELTLPLWRNWLGDETQQQIEQSEALTEQTHETNAFQMKSVKAQAEQAYWNLALVRENLRFAQDSVDRNSSLLAYHKKRVHRGLGDEGDILQAEAALQNSLIGLKSAQDNEITAGRAFNLARGHEAAVVGERLTPLTGETVANLRVPQREAVREDVKAAQAQVRSTGAATALISQKYKPTLELFGSAALNNANPLDRATAYNDSFNPNRPTNMIGIRLNAPLNGGLISDVNLGAARDRTAAEESYQRKLLEQDDDWKSLNEKFHQAQERYQLYSALADKQQKKFNYEQKRRATGRTSTEQVILFEGDLESAQQMQIQSLADLFNVYAQMKLYEEAGK